MPADPRCPRCDGKVSARATWCMHCGADFEVPGDGRATPSRPEAENDLARFVRSFDRNEGTRQVLSIVVTVPVLILLVWFGTPRGGVTLALVATIALGIYFRVCGSAKRVLVHGAYGTAALIVCLRLAAATMGPDPADVLAVVLGDTPFLVVVLLLVAGWRTNRVVPDPV